MIEPAPLQLRRWGCRPDDVNDFPQSEETASETCPDDSYSGTSLLVIFPLLRYNKLFTRLIKVTPSFSYWNETKTWAGNPARAVCVGVWVCVSTCTRVHACVHACAPSRDWDKCCTYAIAGVRLQHTTLSCGLQAAFISPQWPTLNTGYPWHLSGRALQSRGEKRMRLHQISLRQRTNCARLRHRQPFSAELWYVCGSPDHSAEQYGDVKLMNILQGKERKKDRGRQTANGESQSCIFPTVVFPLCA